MGDKFGSRTNYRIFEIGKVAPGNLFFFCELPRENIGGRCFLALYESDETGKEKGLKCCELFCKKGAISVGPMGE